MGHSCFVSVIICHEYPVKTYHLRSLPLLLLLLLLLIEWCFIALLVPEFEHSHSNEECHASCGQGPAEAGVCIIAVCQEVFSIYWQTKQAQTGAVTAWQCIETLLPKSMHLVDHPAAGNKIPHLLA